MIDSQERLVLFLKSKVSNFYKILPLYEKENEGLPVYIHSLHFSLVEINGTLKMEHSPQYIEILNILKALEKEVVKEDSEHRVIKREVFKCCNILWNIIRNIEKEGDSDEQ